MRSPPFDSALGPQLRHCPGHTSSGRGSPPGTLKDASAAGREGRCEVTISHRARRRTNHHEQAFRGWPAGADHRCSFSLPMVTPTYLAWPVRSGTSSMICPGSPLRRCSGAGTRPGGPPRRRWPRRCPVIACCPAPSTAVPARSPSAPARRRCGRGWSRSGACVAAGTRTTFWITSLVPASGGSSPNCRTSGSVSGWRGSRNPPSGQLRCRQLRPAVMVAVAFAEPHLGLAPDPARQRADPGGHPVAHRL
jgi:hypothetical protein